jgi:integrase/recombinase XerD
MPGGRKKKPRPPLGDLTDPHGMASLMMVYLESLHVKNYSQDTIDYTETSLRQFILWCAERSVAQASEVTKPIIDRYQRSLFYARKANGKPLSFRSQHLALSCIKLFFRWLVRNNYILYNPASEIELPRIERRLPKHVLTANEADRVMNLPDISTTYGLRDRAMLETLYSTGVRRRELVQLTIYDIDFERGVVMIRLGKGKKDRMVPIGERALAWIDKYLAEARPQFATEPDDGYLFLTYTGIPFSPDLLTRWVREYIEAAQLGKSGSCHLFRHTVATLMLEGGADVRFVQEMMGHENLQTTQIYTRVSIRKLKEIHTATHPSAKLERSIALEQPADEAE